MATPFTRLHNPEDVSDLVVQHLNEGRLTTFERLDLERFHSQLFHERAWSTMTELWLVVVLRWLDYRGFKVVPKQDG